MAANKNIEVITDNGSLVDFEITEVNERNI